MLPAVFVLCICFELAFVWEHLASNIIHIQSKPQTVQSCETTMISSFFILRKIVVLSLVVLCQSNFFIFIYSMLQTPFTITINQQYMPPDIAAISHLPPDLFILVDQQIIPIHRKLLQSSGYIRYEISSTEKVHIITDQLNSEMANEMMGLFYGHSTTISKHKELFNLLDVADYFEVEIIKAEIQRKMKQEFSQFDVFPTLELAYRFNLHQIFKMCMNSLVSEQFEQINYHRFEFIQCNFTLFQIVLRRHHQMKITDQIQGQMHDTIEEIIRLYCTTHNYNEETKNRLIDKYVKTIVNHGLLKLDLILNKKLLQSEILEKQPVKKAEGATENKRRCRQRKYSCNVETVNKNWLKFGELNNKQTKQFKKKEMIVEEGQREEELETKGKLLGSISKDSQQGGLQQSKRSKYQIKKLIEDNLEESQSNEKQYIHGHDEEIMGKISGLIDQYYAECQTYGNNIEEIKKKLSTIEDSGNNRMEEAQLPKTGRFQSGFKLANTLVLPSSDDQSFSDTSF